MKPKILFKMADDEDFLYVANAVIITNLPVEFFDNDYQKVCFRCTLGTPPHVMMPKCYV